MTYTFPLTHREVTVEPIPRWQQGDCTISVRGSSRGFRGGSATVVHGKTTVRQTVRVTNTDETYQPHDWCDACNASTLAMFEKQEKSTERLQRKVQHLSKRPADFLTT